MTTADAAGATTADAPWERRAERAFTALPYFVAAVSVGLAGALAADGFKTWADFRLSVVLLAAVMVAQLAWHLFRVDPHRDRVLAVAFYVARLFASAVLVALNPWYGVFAWVGIVDAVRFFRRPWSLVGVTATAFVSAGSQLGGYPAWALPDVLIYLGVVGFNALLAGAITFFSHLLEEQSSRRREAIVELEAVNRRLEETLRENAGLHEQLLAQAREAGILDERARLAREIHDTLAQGLTGIVTQLQAADATADPVERHRHLDTAQALARRSLTEARRSVQALRPEALEAANLPDALNQVTGDFRRTYGGDAALTVTGQPRTLHGEVETTVLRAAQEALANAGRHARASRVGVTLSYLDDEVLLDVRDDGVGFVPGERNRSGGGFGLAAMRQRVQRLAGELAVESEPGAGTAVSVRLPALAPAQQNEHEERPKAALVPLAGNHR